MEPERLRARRRVAWCYTPARRHGCEPPTWLTHGCAECGKPIRRTDDKTTIQSLAYHSAFWDRKTRKSPPRPK
jgi:hypothetical protein